MARIPEVEIERLKEAVPVARPPSARPASGTGREDATSGVYYEVYRQDGAPQEEQSAPSSQSRPVWSTMAGKGTRPPARPQGPPGDATTHQALKTAFDGQVSVMKAPDGRWIVLPRTPIT